MIKPKFRAWDKSGGEVMLKVYAIDFYYRKIRFGSGEDEWRNWDDSGEIILMQYTGLKDKNRKEIYEGDIIEDGDAGIFFEVCFIEDGFWGREINTSSNDILRLSELVPSCEVVGNIYQNPELLK